MAKNAGTLRCWYCRREGWTAAEWAAKEGVLDLDETWEPFERQCETHRDLFRAKAADKRLPF